MGEEMRPLYAVHCNAWRFHGLDSRISCVRHKGGRKMQTQSLCYPFRAFGKEMRSVRGVGDRRVGRASHRRVSNGRYSRCCVVSFMQHEPLLSYVFGDKTQGRFVHVTCLRAGCSVSHQKKYALLALSTWPSGTAVRCACLELPETTRPSRGTSLLTQSMPS